MLKGNFRNIGRKAASKIGRWLLAAAVAVITWVSAISQATHERGKRLYEQGQQLYRETRKSVPSTSWQLSKDSSAIYITEKQEP